MHKKGLYFLLEENIHQELEKIAEQRYNGNKTACIQNLIMSGTPGNPLDDEYAKLYTTFREAYEQIIQKIQTNKLQQTKDNGTVIQLIKDFQETTRQMLNELKKLNTHQL